MLTSTAYLSCRDNLEGDSKIGGMDQRCLFAFDPPPGSNRKLRYRQPRTRNYWFLGRRGRDRTCDPRFWRPVLYQLSYAPMNVAENERKVRVEQCLDH